MTVRRLFVLAVAPALLFAPAGSAEVKRDREAVVTRMTADLKYLTSDECEGRGPGTAGIDKAADHIAAAFKEAGLKPGGKDGSYFQPFSVRGSARFAPTSSLSIVGPEATLQPRFRTGFQPVGSAGEGKAHGEIVFAGYGLTAPEQKYDDYEGLDVTGKVVLLLRRTPRYNDKERPFAPQAQMTGLSSLARKIENAEKHKAVGVILVNDSATIAESGDGIDVWAAISMFRSAKIPVVHVKRHLAAGLIRSAYGKTLAELEDEIDRDLKPQSKPLAGSSAAIDVVIDQTRTPVKNVVGVLDGAGPLADETVIIGGHYDHLGYGGSGSMARGANAIHHGADDNASGSTTVIELARRFAGLKDRQGRRLVFMAFSAEELGLLGSVHYCKEPLFPLDKTVAMINLDMVGRLRPDKDSGQQKIDIGGTGTAKEFDPLLERLNQKYNFKIRKTASGLGPSDHQSFFMKKLPVLFFFTGFHSDYHRPSDTWDKINVDGMATVADLVEEIAGEVAAAESRPEFVDVKGGAFRPEPADGARPATPAVSVRLGAKFDYSDEKEGVLIEGVTPDEPAAKAGLKEGDRIMAINGEPVKNITGYMTLMNKAERGKAVELTVQRKDEKLTIKAMPTWEEKK
jgi:hypothetical protein